MRWRIGQALGDHKLPSKHLADPTARRQAVDAILDARDKNAEALVHLARALGRFVGPVEPLIELGRLEIEATLLDEQSLAVVRDDQFDVGAGLESGLEETHGVKATARAGDADHEPTALLRVLRHDRIVPPAGSSTASPAAMGSQSRVGARRAPSNHSGR